MNFDYHIKPAMNSRLPVQRQIGNLNFLSIFINPHKPPYDMGIFKVRK
jgi:hypothetical protein